MREESIISPLHSCLTLLLPVLEGAPPITVTAPRKVNVLENHEYDRMCILKVEMITQKAAIAIDHAPR